MRFYQSCLRRVLTFSLALTALAAFAGCGDNDTLNAPAPGVDTGDADFSSFVALGNSLTAGYQSGALTAKFQEYSFPAMIAERAGVSNFKQPLLADPGIGSFTDPTIPGGPGGYQVLDLTTLANPAGPTITPAPYSTEQLTGLASDNPGVFFQNAGPFNNLGIPGVLAVEYFTAKSATDPNSLSNTVFLDLVLRGSGSTAVHTALSQSPTMATVWLGNNDVLGFATGNAAAVVPADQVKFAVQDVVGALLEYGSKVVLANIPDVLATPYFTTATPDARAAGAIGANDLATLSALEYLRQGQAIPAAMVLDETEQVTVTSTIAAYNTAIAEIAAAAPDHVALVDMNATFNDMVAGNFYVGGVRLTPSYITGGLFSLDGIHPNTVGYGIVANAFIEAINEKWGANIPLVSLASLEGK